jgi:hypothetical protein
MRFDLSQYATVEERLAKFWEDHPDGAIITEIAHREGDTIIFKAYIYFERGGDLVSTGFAEEVKDASPVNKTSFVENAETSAIGRGLSNCNYAMKKRPSREEMEKVNRRNNPVAVTNNVITVTSANGEDLLTPVQRETLGKLVVDLKLNKKFIPYASEKLNRTITGVGEITKKEATLLIAAMIRERTESEESE